MARKGAWWTTVLSLALSTAGVCLAFPKNVPEYVCDEMLPLHHGSKQLNGSDSPYKLVQEKVAFQPNDLIIVTLYSESTYFKGFMVKALDQHDREVGHFENGGLYESAGDCSGVRHVNNKKKTSVNMLWRAPASRTGKVHFKATVVKDYKLNYLGLMSTTVSAL